MPTIEHVTVLPALDRLARHLCDMHPTPMGPDEGHAGYEHCDRECGRVRHRFGDADSDQRDPDQQRQPCQGRTGRDDPTTGSAGRRHRLRPSNREWQITLAQQLLVRPTVH